MSVTTTAGTTIVRRHGNPGGPRLLLCHGNGLAIDFYYPFWSLLVDDFDVIVYDLRNHGWNEVGARREHNVPNLIRDQEQVIDGGCAQIRGIDPTIGVFHFPVRADHAPLAPACRSVGAVRCRPGFSSIHPFYRPGPQDPDYDALAEHSAGMTRRRTKRFPEEKRLQRPPRLPAAAGQGGSRCLRTHGRNRPGRVSGRRGLRAEVSAGVRGTRFTAYCRTYRFPGGPSEIRRARRR